MIAVREQLRGKAAGRQHLRAVAWSDCAHYAARGGAGRYIEPDDGRITGAVTSLDVASPYASDDRWPRLADLA